MCNNAVDFTENRDSVQFQQQEIHELFGDSFQFKECLKNLTQKFDYDKNLLAEYVKRKRQITYGREAPMLQFS